MRTVTDPDREYTCILPVRDDIKLKLLDVFYIEGKTLPEFETLENNFANYIVSGSIIMETGDPTFVRSSFIYDVKQPDCIRYSTLKCETG